MPSSAAWRWCWRLLSGAMAERLLIEADNAAIGVADGVIVEPAGRFDLALRLPGRTIVPGLINAHDHLHRNHYGRLGSPPYPNARAWGSDIQMRFRARIAAGRAVPRREALLRGAWKNLFAGVTSVVHHDPWEADFDAGFPLRVVPLASAELSDLSGLPAGVPWCVHLAEGTDATAAEEVRVLQAAGRLDGRLIAVHGVGMDEAGIGLFRTSGAALVWCPTSNVFLLGRTAAAELLAEGVDVLLGSDSLLSGAGDLVDELRAARALDLVSDERLADAVGRTAARRLGIAEPSLAAGTRADLVVLAKPLLEASAHDVELVLVGGAPRVATRALGERLQVHGLSGRSLTFGGVTRWVDGGARRKGLGNEPDRRSHATTEGMLRAVEG
jgi:cytosine/adenosine deaminase-related metal-dependent hydrolase